MQIANLVATRATCPRRSVGAVIVRDKRIVCTGYNGAPSGLPHCPARADARVARRVSAGGPLHPVAPRGAELPAPGRPDRRGLRGGDDVRDVPALQRLREDDR